MTVSCSIKQELFFLSIKNHWDTERLLFKFELDCSYKIRPYNGLLPIYQTNLKSYPTYYPNIYREIPLTRQTDSHSLSIFGQIVQCIVQLHRVHLWRKRNFCLFKTSVNSLSRSTLSSFFLGSTLISHYFHQPDQFYWSICTIFMLSWIMDFFCLLFACFLFLFLLLSLFSLIFISGQNFISGSKDVATSTAVVELIIRTITLTIVYYSRELPAQ